MPGDPLFREPEDEEVERLVAQALAPYEGLLSAEELAAVADLVRDTASSHPVCVSLRRSLAPRAARARSGEEVTPGEPTAEQEDLDAPGFGNGTGGRR